MRLPDAVYDLFTQMIYRFGLPTTSDEGRAFIQKLAEQAAYELPEQYGQKRADPNRPISDDVLAMVHPTEGLIGWDMFISLATPDCSPAGRGVESIPLTGQTFIPVDAVNHLGAGVPPQEPPQEPPQPDPALVARVAALEGDVKALRERVEALARTGAELVASMAEQTAAAAALTDMLAEVNRKLKELIADAPQEVSTSRVWGHAHTVKL